MSAVCKALFLGTWGYSDEQNPSSCPPEGYMYTETSAQINIMSAKTMIEGLKSCFGLDCDA